MCDLCLSWQTLAQQKQWDKLHHHASIGCPCTGVVAKGDDTVVTVGEDGRISVLSIEQTTPVRVIGKLFVASITYTSLRTYIAEQYQQLMDSPKDAH